MLLWHGYCKVILVVPIWQHRSLDQTEIFLLAMSSLELRFGVVSAVNKLTVWNAMVFCKQSPMLSSLRKSKSCELLKYIGKPGVKWAVSAVFWGVYFFFFTSWAVAHNLDCKEDSSLVEESTSGTEICLGLGGCRGKHHWRSQVEVQKMGEADAFCCTEYAGEAPFLLTGCLGRG